MKKRKLLMVSALSILLTVPLTGCELPLEEQISLQVVVGELQAQVEHEKQSTPPGLAKKGGIPPGLAKTNGIPPGQAKKAYSKGDTVVMVGGLVHPKDAAHPQLISPNGEAYELVYNHTNYDILSIKANVAFVQVKLIITGQKDDSTYYAELINVVGEGNWYYGELEHEEGRYHFKIKDKGGKGKGRGQSRKFIITENRTGQPLQNFKKRDNFYFVQVISNHGDRLQVRLLDIR